MQSMQIPASKARWGTYDALRETAAGQVRSILEDTVKHPGAPPAWCSSTAPTARCPATSSTAG